MLTELDERECWELAETVPVGRVVWTGPGGPMIVPVNFVVHESRVVLHASPYSALVRDVDDSQVVFEVDEIDPVTRSGWSVLIRGRAHVAFRDDYGSMPDVDTWADGARRMTVVIEAHEVTGRRVGAP
jgi:uncharacterized protein